SYRPFWSPDLLQELARGNAVLLVDCRSADPSRLTPTGSGAPTKEAARGVPRAGSDSGLAARELEARDACLPVPVWWRFRHRVVLVDVPEGAVVHRVDVHRGVVAPAGVGVRLHPRTVDDHSFAERHLPKRVAGEPARIADAREDGRPFADAVPQPHVPVLVCGHAPHPAVHPVVRGVGALLEDAVRAAGPPQLVPADGGGAPDGVTRVACAQHLL